MVVPSRIDVTELGKLPEIFGGFPGLDGRFSLSRSAVWSRGWNRSDSRGGPGYGRRSGRPPYSRTVRGGRRWKPGYGGG
jgi:hypothetical protein